MLSCAQDYRKGKRGFQHHIWQATLGDDALVFTTHPGWAAIGPQPEFWTSHGAMPKASAYRNVLMAIYRIDPTENPTYFTHGYFPRHAFDEWTEAAGWVMGRKGDGYVALRALQPTYWGQPQEDVLRLLIADGSRAVWICELGNRRTCGSFEAFADRIADAEAAGDIHHVRYNSPSLGTMEFGWDSPLTVNGEKVCLREYPRFDNPWCHAEFGATRYVIRGATDSLELNVAAPNTEP